MTQAIAKNLAAALKGALASKGIELQLGQALDVMALLSGTKDWNALSATLKSHKSNFAMRHAIQGMLDAARQLADEAGGVPEWNDGGFAREACKFARAALTESPKVETLDGSVDYEMAPDCGNQALWVGVDNISVYIRRNDEGVSVDLYAKDQEDGTSMAGTWALFADAEPDHDLKPGPSGNSWMVYSPNEAALDSDGAGYWSNTLGWVTEADATMFSVEETKQFSLPVSTGGDARWVHMLQVFMVSLTEADADSPILFNCMAEDPDHAKEQAENAYPGCEVHAVELDIARNSAPDTGARVQKAYSMIASAKAWRIDDSPVLTSVQRADIRGTPENEVFRFVWEANAAGEADMWRSLSETVTEEDLAAAVIEGNTLRFPDAYGGEIVLACLDMAPAEIGEPKGTPHICGLPGEHFGGCQACEEVRVYARDLVAEWVGLHYGVNFDAESAARKDEWVARFMDAHSGDNPLFPRKDWEYEVSNGDTNQGYAEWLIHELVVRNDDRAMGLLNDDNDADAPAETGHLRFSQMDWDFAVANGDTKLGYAEWVAHQLEAQQHDRDNGLN